MNPLGSYTGWNQDLTNCPKLKLQSKGRPLGGFGWSKGYFWTTASPLSIIHDKIKQDY